MSEQLSAQNDVPDEAVAEAPRRLASWLNGQTASGEYGVTVEDLEGRPVESEAEFLLYALPGYANVTEDN